eukprot:GHVS01079818.1.p1 GENE.GHVS01079818.1~~GHVS01079818.1.p1  ORF type:complete len:1060 (+),score=251.04 GHVS01079818.1:306-3485(+)
MLRSLIRSYLPLLPIHVLLCALWNFLLHPTILIIYCHQITSYNNLLLLPSDNTQTTTRTTTPTLSSFPSPHFTWMESQISNPTSVSPYVPKPSLLSCLPMLSPLRPPPSGHPGGEHDLPSRPPYPPYPPSAPSSSTRFHQRRYSKPPYRSRSSTCSSPPSSSAPPFVTIRPNQNVGHINDRSFQRNKLSYHYYSLNIKGRDVLDSPNHLPQTTNCSVYCSNKNCSPSRCLLFVPPAVPPPPRIPPPSPAAMSSSFSSSCLPSPIVVVPWNNNHSRCLRSRSSSICSLPSSSSFCSPGDYNHHYTTPSITHQTPYHYPPHASIIPQQQQQPRLPTTTTSPLYNNNNNSGTNNASISSHLPSSASTSKSITSTWATATAISPVLPTPTSSSLSPTTTSHEEDNKLLTHEHDITTKSQTLTTKTTPTTDATITTHTPSHIQTFPTTTTDTNNRQQHNMTSSTALSPFNNSSSSSHSSPPSPPATISDLATTAIPVAKKSVLLKQTNLAKLKLDTLTSPSVAQQQQLQPVAQQQQLQPLAQQQQLQQLQPLAQQQQLQQLQQQLQPGLLFRQKDISETCRDKSEGAIGNYPLSIPSSSCSSAGVVVMPTTPTALSHYLPSFLSSSSPSVLSSYLRTLSMIVLWYSCNCQFNIENKRALVLLPLPLTVSALQSFVGVPFAVLPWLLGLRKPPTIFNSPAPPTSQTSKTPTYYSTQCSSTASNSSTEQNNNNVSGSNTTCLGSTRTAVNSTHLSTTSLTSSKASSDLPSSSSFSPMTTTSSTRQLSSRLSVLLLTIRPFLVQSLWHTLLHISAMVALCAGAVSFVSIVKAAEPVLTAILAPSLFQAPYMSGLTYLSLLPIIFGVGLASLRELSFTWGAFAASMLSNFGSSMRGLTAKQFLSKASSLGNNLTPRNIFAITAVLSAFTELPLILLETPNYHKAWNAYLSKCSAASASRSTAGVAAAHTAAAISASATTSSSLSRHAPLARHILLSGLFYYLYNLLAMNVLGGLHPVSHAVANTLKRVTVIVVSSLIFQTKFTPLGLLGSVVAVAGTFGYSLSKKLCG